MTNGLIVANESQSSSLSTVLLLKNISIAELERSPCLQYESSSIFDFILLHAQMLMLLLLGCVFFLCYAFNKIILKSDKLKQKREKRKKTYRCILYIMKDKMLPFH